MERLFWIAQCVLDVVMFPCKREAEGGSTHARAHRHTYRHTQTHRHTHRHTHTHTHTHSHTHTHTHTHTQRRRCDHAAEIAVMQP